MIETNQYIKKTDLGKDSSLNIIIKKPNIITDAVIDFIIARIVLTPMCFNTERYNPRRIKNGTLIIGKNIKSHQS